MGLAWSLWARRLPIAHTLHEAFRGIGNALMKLPKCVRMEGRNILINYYRMRIWLAKRLRGWWTRVARSKIEGRRSGWEAGSWGGVCCSHPLG